MTEQEIFEKLKEALNYDYLCTDWGETEVTNLEQYLRAIKQEREIERSRQHIETEHRIRESERRIEAERTKRKERSRS